MPPAWLRSRSHGRPAPMWSLSERGLYWVRTTTSFISLLTQLDSVKSMIRYLPANGTAGLARSAERMESLSPSPPASTTARTRFTFRCYYARYSLNGEGVSGRGHDCRAADRYRPVLRPGGLHVAVRGARRRRRRDDPGRIFRDGPRDGWPLRRAAREIHRGRGDGRVRVAAVARRRRGKGGAGR